jgi:hypothetical protein
MIRKSILALAATAALGAVALAPTSASAGGKFFHHHHFGAGFGFYPSYSAPYDCFWEKKFTPFGVKFVKVCSYW